MNAEREEADPCRRYSPESHERGLRSKRLRLRCGLEEEEEEFVMGGGRKRKKRKRKKRHAPAGPNSALSTYRDGRCLPSFYFCLRESPPPRLWMEAFASSVVPSAASSSKLASNGWLAGWVLVEESNDVFGSVSTRDGTGSILG